MIDEERGLGKKTDMVTGFLPVVAAALQRADGRWLMHRRPFEKHHGGLWEFPGGKVEAAEMPVQSLVRELAEELGIDCDPADCCPAAFAETASPDEGGGLVILLYKLTRWQGEPAALEGGAIGWFTREEAMALARPPLDIVLMDRLFRNC